MGLSLVRKNISILYTKQYTMAIVEIHLSRAQENRLRKGLAIRVGASGLQGSTPISVTPQLAKKIESARRRNKGLQIKAEDIMDGEAMDEDEFDGGKIRIGKAFKKLGNSVSHGFNRATGTVRKEVRRDIKEVRTKAPGALRQASKETGRAVEQAKKYVPKEAVAIPLSALATVGATMATGSPQAGLLAGRFANNLVDTTYETNLARGSVGKNFGRNLAKNIVVGELKHAVKGLAVPSAPVRTTASYADVPMAQAVAVGSGIRPLGGRLAKGSPEAKAYMASIRNKKNVSKYTGVGMVQNHVRAIEHRVNPNRVSLTLANDDVGGDFLTRKFKGSGFLPL
jgi:hypothetical protein